MILFYVASAVIYIVLSVIGFFMAIDDEVTDAFEPWRDVKELVGDMWETMNVIGKAILIPLFLYFAIPFATGYSSWGLLHGTPGLVSRAFRFTFFKRT